MRWDGLLSMKTQHRRPRPSLTRTDEGVNFTVRHNSALNRETAFQINNLATGNRQINTTLPDGTQNNLTEFGNGTNTLSVPDGTGFSQTLGGDPRWRMQAPIPTTTTISTPGGVSFAAHCFQGSVGPCQPWRPVELNDPN